MIPHSNTKSKIAAVTVVLIVLILAFSSLSYAPKDDTLFTVTQSSDGDLTYFRYTGDYGFDDYLEVGSEDIGSFYSYLSDHVTCGVRINGVNPVNCSAFCVGQDDGSGYYAGRNFDFRYSNAGIVFADPDDGYASVSTVDLRMFGDTDEPFELMGADVRYNAVAYIPLDGINEKGVFVCINAVNNADPIDQRDEDKVSIFTTSALRLILDYADSTEAAVDLVSRYSLNSDSNFHIFICDASGDCRTVEYVDDSMYVTETQVLTNHYLTEYGDAPLRDSSLVRYLTLMTALEENPVMSESDVRVTMRSVMQDDKDQIHFTRWSVVYDLEGLSASICICKDGMMDWEVVYRHSVERP